MICLMSHCFKECQQFLKYLFLLFQQNRRTRSRSVSSPQSCSPKPLLQQPLQAVSLTDISSPLHTIVSSTDPSGKRAMMSSSHGQSVANSNVLQQNAILAQLLTPGTKNLKYL